MSREKLNRLKNMTQNEFKDINVAPGENEFTFFAHINTEIILKKKVPTG